LNPHDLSHQPLKLTRLPIPPHPRKTKFKLTLFKPFITNAEVYTFKRLVVTNPRRTTSR